ncbi:MAG: outer membrane protein assembly factor BamE [Acetobacteraceae bacterium]|nr:outer membrane protein assembly factor BamE [Acetobacteraceae bacterium]MDW8398427.1 outer membrane protein assembly factor BamE [Acetobacteraceae bacterium]
MEPPDRPVNAARLRMPAAALAALLLAGCSVFETPIQRRGQQVEAEELAQLVPGTSTRADVLALLGTPSATGTFDGEHWYYISAVTRALPGRTLAVEDQRVVAIRFADSGAVAEIRTLGREDGRDIAFTSRETPTPGTERTLLQQLFGNLNRLSPGAAAGRPGN